MLGSPLSRTLQHIRSLLGASAADVSDRQFLERFATGRDEAAFEALVRRHGTLVFGVCRRVLGNDADAEDAFQATFLLLAKKAGTLGWSESIGGWLYKVSCHIATRARRTAARRRQHEERIPPMPPTPPDASALAADLRPILDEELHRLPEKYRLPLLLCYLQGKSREEAARELGWTPGAVKGRLERGRELLRGRLDRRGISIAAVALPALLEQEAAAAMMPLELISKTVQIAAAGTGSAAVTALMKGALQAMFFARLRKVGLLAAITLLVLGSGTSLFLLNKGAPTAQAVPLPVKEPALASEPTEKDGLRVVVTPAKAKFTEGEPLVFTVTMKNTSTEAFLLYDATYFWNWQIRFGDWQVSPHFEAKRGAAIIKLEPGKEVQVEVKLNAADNTHGFTWTGPQKKPVSSIPSLLPGKYPLTLTMAFKAPPPDLKEGRPFWVGGLSTKPVEIEVVAREATEKDGLRVTVTPAKAKFAEGEALAFTVTLKNTSAKAFYLYDADYFWNWQIRFGHWQVQPNFLDERGEGKLVKLEPGKHIQVAVNLPARVSHTFGWTGPVRGDGVAALTSLPAGKYQLAIDMAFKNHPQAAQMLLDAPFWVGELRTKPVEIEIVAEEVSWGEAVDGVRVGLAPPKIEVLADARDITVALLYENTGKENRKVQTFQFGNICHAVKKGEKFWVDFIGEKGSAVPRFVTLKPGERFRESIKLPFEGHPDFGFATLPRPAARQPLTLQAGLRPKPDVGGNNKVSWEAADTRRSGAITVTLAEAAPK